MDQILKKSLQNVVSSVDGLCQIFIADREGVPITYANAPNSSDTVPRPQLLATYQNALEQTSKLNFGAQKHMVCMYGNFQLVQLNCSPFTVTLIATTGANTGMLLNLRKELEPILEQIHKITADTLPKYE